MLKKLALVVLIAAVLVAYISLGGERFVSVDFFQQTYRENPLLSAATFFLLYFLVAAFSLPAAALLTVIAGVIFGLAMGTVLVSFASSLGATVACIFSRFLLRDWVQKKLGGYLDKINSGVEKDGASYLFSLRLIPVFPFWVLNLAFGVTRLPLTKFYLVSQLGMLPGTLVYVNAGAQLGAVDNLSLQGVLTPGVLGAFALLALFPYLSRSLISRWQTWQLYRGFEKPAHFDTNMIVIGAGSAGLVTAYLAAALKAKVSLVEKHRMGGDCLNTGCVPSKALLRAAKAAHDVATAGQLGIDVAASSVDFGRVMTHVRNSIETIAPHDSVERYSELGVDCVAGSARLLSPWAVEINGKVITAPRIVIASGASPRVPDIPGLSEQAFLTSENLWQLDELPTRLLIVGGGPIGCEMAQAFQRLGSKVTVVQRRGQLLPKVDGEASSLLQQLLIDEGVEVLTSHDVREFRHSDGVNSAVICCGDQCREVTFDRVLLAVGRAANTSGLGLEALGIPCRQDGTVEVNDYQQTRFPNILAAGDVCGPYQLTHASSHQAWYAAVNGLFGRFWRFRVDNRLVPSVVYTDPEVASVGLTEAAAGQQGVDVEVTHYPLSGLDRAVTDATTTGFVRILTAPGRDRILGVTIVASRAGEMLMEFISAMKQGKGLNSVLSTIHPYPVFSEANKLAAGQWKRSHTPERLLRWVAAYHRRQRK